MLKRVHDFPLLLKDGKAPDNSGTFGEQESSLLLNDEEYWFRTHVAASMDGHCCDDALVCRFKRPYEELLSLFHTIGGDSSTTRVLHVWATDTA